MPREKEKPEKELAFEKAIERLERIVSEMESDTLTLDQLMAHFEEGTRLTRFCSAKLDAIERKIEILVEQEGRDTAHPFDPAAGNGGQEDR